MKTIRKRRKQRKTDYHKRIKLLKSGIPRIVFRRTNRYVIGQYVESKEARDKVIFGFTSKDLLKYGWPKELSNSLKSIPASYLTGMMVGNKIKKDKLKMPIVDMGMIKMIHKNKTYAFLKGLKDSGVTISDKGEIFPEEDRLNGKFLKTDLSKKIETIKSNLTKL